MDEPCGDDADDAEVPVGVSFDDDVVGIGIEPGAEALEYLFEDVAFQLLAFAVLGIQLLCQGFGLGRGLGLEQVEGGFGRFEATGGVQARG